MRKTHTLILLFLFCSISYQAVAQKNTTGKFKPHAIEALRQDFTVFRESLEEAHPGLYWFQSREEMDLAFDTAFQSLNRPMTEKEFFPKLSRIIASIGCLHTSIEPSDSLIDVYFNAQTKYFPFRLKALASGKVFIFQNYSENDQIQEGSEVLAINGQSMDSISSVLLRHLGSDGYGKGWALVTLEWVFQVYYSFYIDESEQFELSLKSPNESIEKVKVSGLNNDRIQTIKDQRYGKEQPEPNIQLSFNEQMNTAVLRVPRFANWHIEGEKYKFERVLERSMEKIINSGSDHLILDVGDGGGGNELYGLELLSYFIDQSFVGYRSIEFKNKQFDCMKYSNTGWLEYALYRTIMNFRKKDSVYLLTNYKGVKPVKPKPAPLHYSGNVYLLTGRSTASATSDFAAWVHSLGFATIVGEETGGGYYGNTSNWEFVITLPNTRIKVRIPLARYLTNVKDDIAHGRGVVPDHYVLQDIDDFLTEKDAQLKFVYELIRKRSME